MNRRTLPERGRRHFDASGWAAAGSGITSCRAVKGEEAIMYRNILIAVDGSESSKRALLQAIHTANASYEKMTAVYVLDRSAMFMYAASYDQFALVDTLRHDGGRVLADAQTVMAEHGLTCDVEMAETDNISEGVADCLLRCAQRNGADLVVMGTHGRRGMSRITMGSVAERFLRFSCCPVLLVRETW
jgi:nucleotide-binding universal stress UspA family protein